MLTRALCFLTRRLCRHLASAALPLLLLISTPLASTQEALPPGVALQRSLGGISEYRLANGLQLLLMPVPSHAQTHVTVIYRVGARHEGPGEAGMAHLLEHVTFRRSLDTGDLGDALRQAGARFNGTTTLDRTNYLNSFAPSPATLREALRLEAARMSQARLAEPDFLKEKPLVLNEMGLRIHALPRQMHQAMAAGMFRAGSLLAGIAFTFGIAVIYGLASCSMCWRVRGGSYPSPLPASTAGTGEMKRLVHECFGHRFYVGLFLAMMLSLISFSSVNNFGVFYAQKKAPTRARGGTG